MWCHRVKVRVYECRVYVLPAAAPVVCVLCMYAAILLVEGVQGGTLRVAGCCSFVP
jgi:hypothetical protein